MHTQSQDIAMGQETATWAASNLPNQAPDTGRIAPGLGWLLSRSLAIRADRLQRAPKPYRIDFMHILKVFVHIFCPSWQQSGYKRNEVQWELLNRWEKEAHPLQESTAD